MFLQENLTKLIEPEKADTVVSKLESTVKMISGMKVDDAITYILKGLTAFGWDILVCVLIFVVGRWIIRYIDRMLDKVFTKRGVELSIAKFVRSFLRAVLYIIVTIAIIKRLGIDTTSFLALFASVGVGIGMAMSGTLQNFAGGIMVLLTRPFKIGDYVQMQGVEGTVKEIRLFNTTINTIDNKLIIIPNGSIVSNIINNYSAEDIRRIDWTFGISYGDNFDVAKAAIMEIIAADPRILKTPEPFISISALADSSVNLTVRAWAASSDYWNIYYAMNEKIYKTLPTKGLSFPFPQVDVHLPKQA